MFVTADRGVVQNIRSCTHIYKVTVKILNQILKYELGVELKLS